MTRPDDTNGPSGHPQQWAWSPYPGHSFASAAPQQTYQAPQQAYLPHQQYPPHQAYSGSWDRPRSPFPAAPMPAMAAPVKPKPSTGKLVALALAGFLLVGLLGGAVLVLTGTGKVPSLTSPATPAASTVTMSLPPVVDGHPLVDNEYSRQLVAAARQQLAAVSSDPVIGMYGAPEEPPAFVVIAGTTSVAGSPDLVLTGMAAGFQQSLGAAELEFVDQPAGPLGGTMRCAQHAPMTTCMWSIEGAFGMNMVFQQDLAQAAATTVRVRGAIETHSR